ncbi:protein YgfX [Mycoavidus sp. SF9855]|uniref:protein YgfX n=1 Tax=Mycoavidus sp. SF9855 TaxID=2968475 RepID=UPI00211C4495|nr:protein YgfX [Mycoavidus sp. SF9855]UUM21211.1 hypothetical protein NQD60_07130 [Mycoavidus sp. SF9855]
MMQAPIQFELKPSTVLRWLTLAFILCCTYAVWRVAAPRVSVLGALLAACVVLLVLSYMAYRVDAQQAFRLEISAQGITTWHRAGRRMRCSQISDMAYWGGLMLSITVRASDGRSRKILILADALPSPMLRELVVRCRQLSKNCNHQL